jgi:hypothetical protein
MDTLLGVHSIPVHVVPGRLRFQHIEVQAKLRLRTFGEICAYKRFDVQELSPKLGESSTAQWMKFA